MKVEIGPYPKYNKKTKRTPKRKVKVTVHKYDTWGADHTLALIAVPLLKKFRSNLHGYPGDFCGPCDKDGIEIEGNHTVEILGATYPCGIAGWELVLDKIIWALEQCIDEDDEFYIIKKPGKMKFGPIDPKTQCGQLIIDPPGVYNWDAKFAYNERIQEGLELFGKFFRNLWD